MRVDLDALAAAASDIRLLQKIVDDTMNEATTDDPPLLSDLMAANDAGVMIRMELEEYEKQGTRAPVKKRFTWKLRVLCDEWGNKLSPGDVVYHKRQKGLSRVDKRDDSKIITPTSNLIRAKMDGSYNEKYVEQIEYVVDEKGCIECGFESAGYFIYNNGVHPISNHGICPKPQKTNIDFTGQPRPEIGNLKTAPDGQDRHVWNWRYKEVTPEDYEKLPKIKKQEGKRRGFNQ